MGEIKSAFEKAMERVAKLEKASAEELKRMEYVPQGNIIAAKYLREEATDLKAELAKYEEGVRKYLIEGLNETLLGNITLPQNEGTGKSNKRTMEGILTLKENKGKAKGILDKLENLLSYYGQARQQAYLQLKRSFEAKLEGAQRALEQQLGTKVQINVEPQPQFQEEWRKIQAELNSKYERVLEENKQELKRIR